MTREEAIKILQGAIKKPNTKDGYLGQALDMAIKALEQEPCEDAISRQAVLVEMKRRHDNGDQITLGFIKSLPPVTPQEPKIGHWINHKDEHQCSQCRETVIADKDVWEEYPHDYCPSCGVRLIELQEGERK